MNPLAGVERRARATLTWSIRYGLPGVLIRRAARNGDLLARTAVDPQLRADPFAAYDEIRALGPVVQGRFIAATTHYEVARDVLRNEAFLVGPGNSPITVLEKLLAWSVDPWAMGPDDPPSLLAIDGAAHSRLRKLVTHAFNARTVAALAPRVEALAEELLEQIEGDTFDLVSEYAALLPVTVIAEILGVPVDNRREFIAFGQEAAKLLDPALSWGEFCAANQAARDGHRMMAEHIESLRRDPQDDLLSELIAVRIDGDRLTDIELRQTALLLLGAGFETTQNLIGNAVVLLLQHPDQLAALQQDESHWAGAVEETLRYDSPVQITLRVSRDASEIGGVTLQPLAALLVMVGGANRDPAVFADPHTFDITRANAREHLAFSSGAHYCIGAQLARLESTIGLKVLFRRHPDLALAGVPVRRGTRVLRGYQQLPVKVTRTGSLPIA